MMSLFNAAKTFVLDLLFPIHCLGCKKEGSWLCQDCFSKIELNKKQFCPSCLHETISGEFCDVCQTAHKLSGVTVASSYKNKLLQKAIQFFKYRFAEELALPLSEILIAAILKSPFHLLKREMKSPLIKGGEFQSPSIPFWKRRNCILIPVPLHKSRYLWRGFNQAELLANEIGKKFNLPVTANVLTRTKNTTPQTQLNILERKTNITGAFKCLRPNLIADKNIILIDDVCTTSATLEECAKILFAAGHPRQIWGLVIARG